MASSSDISRVKRFLGRNKTRVSKLVVNRHQSSEILNVQFKLQINGKSIEWKIIFEKLRKE